MSITPKKTGLESPPVFHHGELALQDRVGVSEKLAVHAQRVIRRHLTQEHRSFYAGLPMMIVGAVAADGQPWASAVFGPPGFLTTPDDVTLNINSEVLLSQALGLLQGNEDKIGLLGLDPATRRRNRLNGVVRSQSDGGLSVGVEQSFGNCPQYIQQRTLSARKNAEAKIETTIETTYYDELTADIKARLELADTFFIASRAPVLDADPRNGVDVSHRGGRPGFVAVNNKVLSFPDFRGNNYFNTLGNIQLDERVGLFFPDFESGHAIYVSGHANVVWDGHRVAEFAAAERIIDVQITKVIDAKHALPIHGEFIEQSPRLAKTGVWSAAATGNQDDYYEG